MNFLIRSIVGAALAALLFATTSMMMQSIRERTPELAVLKTLGFTDPSILALVIGESLLLTLVGGAIGIGGALLAVGSLSHSLSQYLSAFLLTPRALLLGVMLMLALGIVAGALPAVRAARLRIVDGLAGR